MRLPKITPSLLISILALVVALGGTSYAAAKINGRDIVNNSIGASKLKKDSIGGGKIKNNSLGTNELTQAARDLLRADNTRWALINGQGQIVRQSGGFLVTAAYPVLPNTAAAGAADNSLRAAGNVYINAGVDLTTKGLSATIVLQNTVDQNGDGVTNGRAAGDGNVNPEFSGEISISRCNAPGTETANGPTNCAPTVAQNASSFVVSPRLSNGGVTTDGNRKSFYVVITG